MVSARFGVSRSYVIKARQRRDRQRDLCAGVQRSHTLAKLEGHNVTLRARVQAPPDATLAELVDWAGTELGISLSIKAMSKRLKVFDLTLKKDADRCRAAPR